MNILILSHHWHPENGVHQRRWSWLCRMLTDAGHRVVVVTPPPHYQRTGKFSEGLKSLSLIKAQPEQGPSGETIIRCPYLPSGHSITGRALNQAFVATATLLTALVRARAFDGAKPDLVIGTVPALPTSVITSLVALFLRRPYIIDLRDAWPDLLDQAKAWNRGTGEASLRGKILSKGPLKLVTGIIRATVNQTLRKSSGIMVTSANLEHHLRNSSKLWRSDPVIGITTVRNVFPSETNYQATDKSLGPADELNVLYAGTLGRAQHLHNVIEAVRIAGTRGLTVHLRMVGAGATRQSLVKHARDSGCAIEILGRKPADELNSDYDWADTALVHLTDWEPLTRAVPSKTYELMTSNIHISAVVAGEAADLVTQRGAGDVVPPEDPKALADLWIELARDRDRLTIRGDGARWVAHEREVVVPERLLNLIESAARAGDRPIARS